MPQVRIRQNYHHVSDFDRGKIMVYRDVSLSCYRVNCTIMTGICVWYWAEEGRETRRRLTGQPTCTTEHQGRRFRQLFLQDHFATTCYIADHFFLGLYLLTMRFTIYKLIW